MALTFLKKKTFIGKSVIEFAKTEPYWALATHGVSQGMLMEFLACREKARLGYVEGWNSEHVSNAIVFGQLFHSALESLYKHMRIDGKINGPKFVENIANSVLKAYKAEIEKERIWTPEDEQNLLMDAGYLHILLPAYVEKYWEKDSKQKWLIVEDAFQNQYGYPVNEAIRLVDLKGRYDQVFKNKNEEVWIKEVKTKSRFDPAIQDKLKFDFLAFFYLMNYRLEFDVMPSGFVYDMIQRPALRKGANETLQHFMERVKGDVDETYFKRIRMRVTSEELDTWIAKDFTPILQDFIAWDEGKTPSFRNPASCETRYGVCKFIRACGIKDYAGLVRKPHNLLEEKSHV